MLAPHQPFKSEPLNSAVKPDGGVFTFTTWADEQAIDQYIEANKVRAAVVLGGGLIGLKTVEALVDREVPVTVVELADRILAVTFDTEAARLAEKVGVSVEQLKQALRPLETKKRSAASAIILPPRMHTTATSRSRP